MIPNKFANSHLVITKNRNRSGPRNAMVVLMLPILLSSCQPVAAGFAGISFGIFMLISILTMGAFGIRLEKNKSIATKSESRLNTQPIISKN